MNTPPTDDLLSFTISDCIREMRKPRLVCICGDFRRGERDWSYCFWRCTNCNGWMSDERIANAGR